MTLASRIWPGLYGLRDQLAAVQADVAALESVIEGGDWQDSVLTRTLNTPPPTPAIGARYIVATGGVDAWAGKDNNVATYMSTGWTFDVPNKGAATMTEDTGVYHYFTGTTWVRFENALDHSQLSGVTATQHHDNANDPSADQKQALAGSYGTPGTLNPYITKSDPYFMKATSAILHVYADGTTGSDANDGLTLITPKKTLQAVFDLVPYIVQHNCCIHLSGVFTSNIGILEILVAKYSVLVIDGGTATTVVADNAGSPWIGDISSVASIGLTTLGATPDAHMGYFVEILTGPAAGQTRMIHSNTATTIVPVQDFSVDPSAGANFRIIRPTTELTSWSFGRLVARNLGYGTIQIQNLFASGSRQGFDISRSPGTVAMSHVIDDTASVMMGGSATSLLVWNTDNFTLRPSRYNATTFALESANTFSQAGYGQVQDWALYGMFLLNANMVTIQGSVVKALVSLYSVANQIDSGCRFGFWMMIGCQFNPIGSQHINSTPGYAITRFGGHLVWNTYWNNSAINMFNSNACLGGYGIPIDLSGGYNGLEVVGSQAYIFGLSGTNRGAGCYAARGSQVSIADAGHGGIPNTVTGAKTGNITVDQGLTLATTWAAVEAGTSFLSGAELTRIGLQ